MDISKFQKFILSEVFISNSNFFHKIFLGKNYYKFHYKFILSMLDNLID